MFTKDVGQRCVLIIIATGFKEAETITILSAFRRAGLCVKTVSLTNGLVDGGHGIWLMPDLTLADLDHLSKTTAINLVILPEGGQTLARLEADPRVHKLLRQVVAQRGQIVTGSEGLRLLRVAAVWAGEPEEADDGQQMPVLWRDPAQPPEAFARDLIRRLRESPGV